MRLLKKKNISKPIFTVRISMNLKIVIPNENKREFFL